MEVELEGEQKGREKGEMKNQERGREEKRREGRKEEECLLSLPHFKGIFINNKYWDINMNKNFQVPTSEQVKFFLHLKEIYVREAEKGSKKGKDKGKRRKGKGKNEE